MRSTPLADQGEGKQSDVHTWPVRLNVPPRDVDRIARDRPDILERMKAGEFAYVRQAAIAAGIIIAGGRSLGSRLRKPAAHRG